LFLITNVWNNIWTYPTALRLFDESLAQSITGSHLLSQPFSFFYPDSSSWPRYGYVQWPM